MKGQFNKLEDILLWKKSKFKPKPRYRVVATVKGSHLYNRLLSAWLYYPPDEIIFYEELVIVRCAYGSIG